MPDIIILALASRMRSQAVPSTNTKLVTNRIDRMTIRDSESTGIRTRK